MKIYSLPPQVPAPEPDYANYDSAKEMQRERDHTAVLAAWLKANGFPGKMTGEIYSEGVADGSALYMVADGRQFALVHLPYGDAYQSRNVAFLTKKEIIRRLEATKAFNKAFANAKSQETAG